jgi:hypothetical protein
MLDRSALKRVLAVFSKSVMCPKELAERVEWKRRRTSGFLRQAMPIVAGVSLFLLYPALLLATHEADHRFTVEGFVCGPDGKGDPNVEVLVKDTRISYGQTVTTDGDGYYKATFHLHNDNLGDPLFIEARGEQQNQKVQFDPKDLEAERRIQVNFGAGCIHDRSAPPVWVLSVAGLVVVGVGGVIGRKLLRARRKKEAKREKGQKGQGRRGK